MVIGVPREIKEDEARVGLIPSGVAAFVARGHTVLVETGAGSGSGICDAAYTASGAGILDEAEQVWRRADMIVKVKEPLGVELDWMREGQIIYCYFHLASNESLTQALLDRKVAAVAYETIQLEDGSLPLLAPMSEVAGRLSVQMGAQCLESPAGGSGILLGGVSGVKPADVVVLGAGITGFNACNVAHGMGARVTVLDLNASRLRYIYEVTRGNIMTLMSSPDTVADELTRADLVIGAVLVPGARAPRVVTRDMVGSMKSRSVIVDIAIDQGGCCETSRPTTHSNPTYIESDIVHYCVSNMPGAVPRTSTYALTNVTLGYGLKIAQKGLEHAIASDPALALGVNTYKGRVTHQAVAAAFGMAYHEV